MYQIIMALEEMPVRSLLRESLKNMYGLDEAESGSKLIEKLQSKRYVAMIIGEKFDQINSFRLLNKMRKGVTPQPNLLFMIRSKASAIPKSAMYYESARILSVPGNINEMYCILNAETMRLEEKKWGSLSALQQDMLKVHKSIFKCLLSKSVDKFITSNLFERGIDTIIELAKTNQVRSLLETLKDYDDYTFTHNISVASLMTVFGIGLGMAEKDLKIVTQAGMLHDVGKKDIPLGIINKPGRLDPEEWIKMKTHVKSSIEILSKVESLSKHVINVAAQHHEKIDGSGYPFGLKGADIDDLSMVCTITDVFSALTDKRPYKSPIPKEQAICIMSDMCGDHLDPGLFTQFKKIITLYDY